MTDRLTVNAGLRYDLVTGFRIDQSKIPNFVALTAARRPRAASTACPASTSSARRRRRTRTTASRASAPCTICAATARDVVRAGWGIYYDFGYTNANILFPGLSAQGGSGVVFDVNNTAGIRNPDGSFFTVGQPIIEHRLAERGQPERAVLQPQRGGAAIRQPWTSQTSAGWSHELTPLDGLRRRLRRTSTARTSACGGR